MAENSAGTPRRRGKGRQWEKGQSGNPGGRPAVLAEVKALAAAHGPGAIKTLAAIAKDGDAPPAARVAACNSILDRWVGKPTQAIEHGLGEGEGAEITVVVRKLPPEPEGGG